MTKRLLFLIILIGFSMSSYAQLYDSLVKPGKKWYYIQFIGEQHIPSNGGNIYISEDWRTHDSLDYYKIIDRTFFKQDSLWIREEDKRIYFLNLNDTMYQGKEVLMYDFNLEKGDSFRFKTKIFNEDSFLNALLIVDTTFIINNRKNIKFKTGHLLGFGTFFMENWVEGIGVKSVLYYSFEHYYFVRQPDFAVRLTCLFDNQKQILPLNGICDSTLFNPEVEIEPIKIYPNPSRGNFNIHLNDSKLYNFKVYNNLGQQIEEYHLEGSKNYQVKCEFPKGLYRLSISNQEFNYHVNLFIE